MSTPLYPQVYKCNIKLNAYADAFVEITFIPPESEMNPWKEILIVSIKVSGQDAHKADCTMTNLKYRVKLAYESGDYYKENNMSAEPKHPKSNLKSNYKSKRIVMLDIETLGVRAASSQILSIGAVDNFGKEFYHNVCYGSSKFWADRLTTEPETLNWWLNTAPLKAIESIRDPKYLCDIEDALVSFARYLQGADEIWCNGASFDLPKLDWHYAQLNLATPWSYKALRCYRTSMAGKEYPKKKECAHNALQDAKDQLETLLYFGGGE